MYDRKEFWDNYNEDLLHDIRWEKLVRSYEPSFGKVDVKNEYDEQFVLLILFIALIGSMALLYESLLNL